MHTKKRCRVSLRVFGDTVTTFTNIEQGCILEGNDPLAEH